MLNANRYILPLFFRINFSNSGDVIQLVAFGFCFIELRLNRNNITTKDKKCAIFSIQTEKLSIFRLL
jgi:hypothetical protein